MYIQEKGVLPNSNTYFNMTSKTASEMFFYIKCAGFFYCDANYSVKRDSYYSYLLMHIRDGSGFVRQHGKYISAKANDLVLIDCYKPHEYFTDEGWVTQWIHFDGNFSRQFVELINQRSGYVISLEDTILIQKYLTYIIDELKTFGRLSEPLVSSYIHRMLSELLLVSTGFQSNLVVENSPVMEAISYIESNFNKKIRIDELATEVSLSPFHFSRVFKKETGYSPYEYIIKVRINKSKILLKKTSLSVNEIAYRTGFKSESNFISTFRTHVNLTPKNFRDSAL